MISIPRNIPTGPGVYIFFKKIVPIYIGKAVNLKKRLSSYWRKNADDKVRHMVEEATKVDWIETGSDIEALLKEAELVKKYRPRWNYALRDDKNYFYVGVTKDAYPRFFVTHQPIHKYARYIGPFTSGAALKTTLQLLRRIFPYCTCRKPHKRPCLNSEIGRCPGFCCNKNNPFEKLLPATGVVLYRKNIESIGVVLKGKKRALIQRLKREMHQAAGSQEFERAARLRDQILGLENIFRHRLILETKRSVVSWPKIQKILQMVLNSRRPISRVEGYDISNLSGTEATGSMVVFEDGFPKKTEYRKFKIRGVKGPNDLLMLKEVIRRRLAHREWPHPDLMLIDGGKPQLNAALAALRTSNQLLITNLVALAKREEELYIPGRILPIRLDMLPSNTAHFLKHVRDESHRFAKKYHHKLREIFYRER